MVGIPVHHQVVQALSTWCDHMNLNGVKSKCCSCRSSTETKILIIRSPKDHSSLMSRITGPIRGPFWVTLMMLRICVRDVAPTPLVGPCVLTYITIQLVVTRMLAVTHHKTYRDWIGPKHFVGATCGRFRSDLGIFEPHRQRHHKHMGSDPDQVANAEY